VSDDLPPLWEHVEHCEFCGRAAPFRVVLTAEDIFVRFHKGPSLQPWQLVECSCGMRFISPRWSLAYFREHLKTPASWLSATHCYQYGNFAQLSGVSQEAQKEHLRIFYTREYRDVRPLIAAARPRVVDVGSSVAWALKTFVGLDADREGSLALDVDPEACRINREQFGLRAVCSPITELPADVSRERFDFVHCNDFVEHSNTPHGDLRVMRRLARDGAVLWLKTFVEDLDEPAGRTMLAPYGHMQHFSTTALRRALECAGWQPIRWEVTAGVQFVFICVAA
jgi:hypothetical protein